MPAEERFDAMGTRAHVLVVAETAGRAARMARDAVRRIEDLEARWSRFRPTSELSRLNACAGTPAIVSPDTMRLVQSMRAGHGVTEGAYDPTVLPDVIAQGYDRDFTGVVAPGTAGRYDARRVSARRASFAEVTVSATSSMVWLPA